MRKNSSSTDTPDPLIDAFIDSVWLEDGLSALTLAAYRRDLNALALWLHTQNTSLSSAVEADLQAYFAHRHTDTKATSANRRMTVFRRFYRWALRDNCLLVDPTLKLLSAKQPQRLPKSLSEAQVEALLNAPDTDTALGLRDRAMLELLYASGLRVSELVGLPMLSLNLREGVLRITGKGNKERLVPFGEEAADSLQNYLSQSRPLLLGKHNSSAVFVTQQGAAMSRVMFGRRPCALVAPHLAPCVCHAFAQPWCRFTCGANAARAFGYFHHHHLHPCGPRAAQGASRTAPSAGLNFSRCDGCQPLRHQPVDFFLRKPRCQASRGVEGGL